MFKNLGLNYIYKIIAILKKKSSKNIKRFIELINKNFKFYFADYKNITDFFFNYNGLIISYKNYILL